MASNTDGVYTRKDRPGYWISWQDAQGKRRYRRTNAQTLSQARKIRAAELVRVEQARVIGFTPPGHDTFAELAERFIKYQKPRLTPHAFTRESSLITQHLTKHFAGKVAGIRRVDIQKYVTMRSVEASAHSVQKEINSLKHMLRMAVEWEMIPYSPAQGIKCPRVPAGRVRYLQPTELAALLASAPDWLTPIIGLAVATGMRRSEMLSLRWLDIDLHHSRLMLPQTKNGEGRVVYLNKMARSVFESLELKQRKSSDKVFQEISPEQVSVAFARLCRKLNIHDFRFHDLRHTAASWLRMQGADIHTVAQLLGHKDLRMAARYQHLSPAFLADAVSRLDSVFGDSCYRGVTAPKQLVSAAAAND